MHLKNWSIIEEERIIRLTPAYDFVNTEIVLHDPNFEMALSFRGKHAGFEAHELLQALPKLLKLPGKLVDRILERLQALPWQEHIRNSELPARLQQVYLEVVRSRLGKLDLA